jgi:hypothetical protein
MGQILRTLLRVCSDVFCSFNRGLVSSSVLGLLFIMGCGTSALRTTGSASGTPLKGSTFGGQQPVNNALIQIYAMGTSGDGSPSTPLLDEPVYTDSSGLFSITGDYTCPAPSAQLYIVATGGNPGLGAGMNNSGLAMMSLAGTCANIASHLKINEVTTVASVSALAPFMSSYSQIGSGSNDIGALDAAVTTANALANFSTGTPSGPALLQGQTVPVAKIMTLADILAACVNTAGGVAGDGSHCGSLFTNATSSQRVSPSQTIGAMANIAQNPTNNVAAIFLLCPSIVAYLPTLSSPPTDWTLPITSAVPTPTLSPAPGSYTGPQAVTLSGSGASAQIYYTTDGSAPFAASQLYTGPIEVSASTTIRAVAILNGLSSALAVGSYTIAPPVSVAVSPGSVTLTVSQTQAFTTTVANTSSSTVTWSLNPALGSISAGGLYTAPATIANAQTVTVTATSAADSTKSAAASVSLTPMASTSATYYLSPTGQDTNNGTSSSTPWLTPNHAINCGDMIIALASTSYSAVNFAYRKWGPVTCNAGNNVAWLKCAIFDACKISSNGLNAMALTASYWGVQGWELTTTATSSQIAACIAITPSMPSASIHHIVIADMICNGAAGGGINTYNNGAAGIDYLAVVGNAIYNSIQSGLSCYSGISLSGMASVDSMPGTHTYVGGNISWDNIEPSACQGGNTPTDGEGIIFDTWSGYQTGLASAYSSQALMDNNILVRNGGRGVTIYRNTSAPIYVRNNTMAANNQQSGQATNPYCSEFYINLASYTQAWANLVGATNASGCNSNPLHALGVVLGDNTDTVYSTFAYAASGSPTVVNSSGTFAFGSGNTLGTNPAFVSTSDPGAPSCGNSSSVSDCLASLIANFTPTATMARSYGYQIPSAVTTYDPLFPVWLCNVNLPSGLVTLGCGADPGSLRQTNRGGLE